MSLHAVILLSSAVLAVLLGAFLRRSDFCTMGAVSDWVNIGNLNRMKALLLAIVVAALLLSFFEAAGWALVSMSESRETAPIPYRSANFLWGRYLFGGLLFGLGMPLAGGCSSKALVRLGGGNLKSLLVLAALGCGAYITIYSDWGQLLFLSWTQPLQFDMSAFSASQDGATLLARLFGMQQRLPWAVLLTAPLLFWILWNGALYRERRLFFCSLLIGLLVALMWLLSSSSLGQQWLEEGLFMDQPPSGIGAQSFTFVGSLGQIVRFLLEWDVLLLSTVGVVVASAVIAGSAIDSLWGGKWRLEWFRSWADVLRHGIGGLLMGVGGVLAMGCPFGQGIGGGATLALGSLLALSAMLLGAAIVLKIWYYRVMNPESGNVHNVAHALADLCLFPARLMRRK